MKNIAISLTHKCNAHCEHCCFDCSPSNTRSLSTTIIKELVDFAVNNKHIKRVSFTGGEPFLRENLLYESIKEVKDSEKITTCVTNGFWAKDMKTTKEKLQKLYILGLDTLSISFDDFHQRYINLENIKNILRCRIQIPIKMSLNMTITNKDTGLLLINKLDNNLLDIPINRHAVIMCGRAKNITKNNFIQRYNINNCLACGDRTLFINSDGKCYPCCSPVIAETCLCLGDIHKESIDVVWKRFTNNKLLYIIKKEGLNWFIDICRKDNIIKFREMYGSPCEVCKNIFKNINTIEKLLPYIEKYHVS